MARTKQRGRRGRTTWEKADDDKRDNFSKASMTNERFSSYYKAQNLVPEGEWNEFIRSLKQPLPTTFRVAGSRRTANTLNASIKNVHVPSLCNVVFQGKNIAPPVQIPWYPDGLAWQLNVPKNVLRKSPEFRKFHSFLVFETEVGNISRQEAVSMLPPLFLEVEPCHKVLDMCAAPGSKTAQILEALHSDDSVENGAIPPGLLIANDTDNKRTHLLIHQSARLPSPAFMVTNLDASIYPIIRIPTDPPSGNNLQQLLFDRILCDVPCSGDGTIRKNVGIWKHWQPMDGNGLHSLQVRILQRAFKLLKDDGRIVYSTCSLNPVENEAVIAEALKSNPDFQLVDISEKIPELQRRPGLTSWRPTIDRSVNTTYATHEDFMRSDDAKDNEKMSEGHWPPQDVANYSLTRCIRVYPHLQDTGGFFVAVLEKKRSTDTKSDVKKRDVDEPSGIPESKKPRLTEDGEPHPQPSEGLGPVTQSVEIRMDSTNVQASAAPVGNEKRKKRGKGSGENSFKEHPFTFLSPTDPILMNCIERLSLTNGFPSSNALVRNPEGEVTRFIYLANDLVKAVIENNDYTRIRLTAAGTKMLAKQDGGKDIEPQFRVLDEGLPAILRFINPSTIIAADIPTLRTLIESNYPLITSFHETFRRGIEARSTGSHIVRFPPGELDDSIMSHEIVLPIWKSHVSLTLMMDKKTKKALSMRLFGSDISLASRKPASEPRNPGAAETSVHGAEGTSIDIIPGSEMFEDATPTQSEDDE